MIGNTRGIVEKINIARDIPLWVVSVSMRNRLTYHCSGIILRPSEQAGTEKIADTPATHLIENLAVRTTRGYRYGVCSMGFSGGRV